MLLRLRQGIGRLIRSNEDRGTIHIYAADMKEWNVMEEVEAVLPVQPV